MISHTLKKTNFLESLFSEIDISINQNYIPKDSRNISYTIQWQLSRSRAGSANTKLMSEISGTTAKPYKQKGTGNARQGSKRSVQFVGGRTCHGPRSRSFDFSLPKKIKKTALLDSLFSKIVEKKLIIFTANQLVNKTSYYSKFFINNNIKSALIVTPENVNSCQLSIYTRNLKMIKSINFDSINTYDIIKHNYLMIEESLLERIIDKFN